MIDNIEDQQNLEHLWEDMINLIRKIDQVLDNLGVINEPGIIEDQQNLEHLWEDMINLIRKIDQVLDNLGVI